MLAQNFKTPADLYVTDAEFDALSKVLGMLERGEINRKLFDMNTIGFTDECGTPACMLGWAQRISGNPKLFERIWGDHSKLDDLFLYKCAAAYKVAAAKRHVSSIKPDQAAIALRNFLTHGEPRWSEALADARHSHSGR